MSPDDRKLDPPVSDLELVDPPQVFVNEPNWRWETIIPDYYNIWYSIEGRGAFYLNNAWYSIKPGTVFIFPPGQLVQSRQNPNETITNFTLHTRLQLHPTARNPFRSFLFGYAIRNREDFDSLMRLAVDAGRQRDPLGQHQAHRLSLSLIDLLWRDAHEPQRGEAERRILKLVEAIDRQPGGSWNLAREADRCGLSRTHFTRLFTRATGQSPGHYIIDRRIQRAKSLLETTPMRISEIADALGYSDVYFFSRQFSTKSGVSPSSWRNQSNSHFPENRGPRQPFSTNCAEPWFFQG